MCWKNHLSNNSRVPVKNKINRVKFDEIINRFPISVLFYNNFVINDRHMSFIEKLFFLLNNFISLATKSGRKSSVNIIMLYGVTYWSYRIHSMVDQLYIRFSVYLNPKFQPWFVSLWIIFIDGINMEISRKI